MKMDGPVEDFIVLLVITNFDINNCDCNDFLLVLGAERPALEVVTPSDAPR